VWVKRKRDAIRAENERKYSSLPTSGIASSDLHLHRKLEPDERRVQQIDLGTGRVIETWANVAAARAHYGHRHNGVSKACRGLQEEAYNYGWRFEDASASVCEDEQQQSMFHDQGGGIDRRLDDVAIADPEAEGKVAAEPTKKNRRAVGGDAPPTVESSQGSVPPPVRPPKRKYRKNSTHWSKKGYSADASLDAFFAKSSSAAAFDLSVAPAGS
jgi:hypothetical protein